MMNVDPIVYLEKPDRVSWEDIRSVIWQAHADNFAKGVFMRYATLSAEEIRERVEGAGTMFVAMAGERVVGTAAVVARRFRLWCGWGDYAYFCFAAVHPEYTGRGIYHELCRICEDRARTMSLSRMLYDTNEKNVKVLEISQASGYRPVGHKRWEDHYSLVMAKWLDGCPFKDWQCRLMFRLSKGVSFLLKPLWRMYGWGKRRILHRGSLFDATRPAAIIIGQGFTGRLSLARSLAQAGCRVRLIVLLSPIRYGENLSAAKPVDAYSRYVTDYLFCNGTDQQKLIDLLLQQCAVPGQKPLIVPDNDFSAAVIDAHQAELAAHFVFPHIPPGRESVRDWMDKMRQKQLARETGLSVAASTVVRTDAGASALPRTIGYPCFVKPLASMSGRKWGIRRCPDEDDLRRTLRFMYEQWGPVDVLVEDYKEIEKEYAVVGFTDGTNVVIPGVLEMSRMGYGRHFGVALQGTARPADGREVALLEQFSDLVRKTGFQGLFDIDYFESGGTVWFCELNLRFGGSGYVYTKLGVNLPAMMFQSFNGWTLPKNQQISGSAVFFNERVAMDAWYDGYMSLKDYRNHRDAAEVRFVHEDNDAAPGRALTREFIAMWFKHTIKSLLGRELDNTPKQK